MYFSDTGTIDIIAKLCTQVMHTLLFHASWNDKQLDPKLYLVDFNLLIRGLFRHTIPLFCYRQIFKNLFQVIDVSSGKTKFKSQKMANFYEQRIERLESENLDMRGEILR